MNAIVEIDGTEFEPARLTREGILALADSGFFDQVGRAEVIDGVLVTMSPNYLPHGTAAAALTSWCFVNLGSRFVISSDTLTLFGEAGMHAPDIAFFDPGTSMNAPDCSALRLAVEISDSSLTYDLGKKASIYAAHGVADYWVVDLLNRKLILHRDPGPEGYGSVVAQAWADPASPLIAPEIQVLLEEVLPI